MKSAYLSKLNVKLWLGLLLISGIVLLYFTTLCTKDLFHFFSLTQSVPATNVRLRIFENHKEMFQIEAIFSYSVKDQEFTGIEVLTQPIFDNPYQAKKTIETTMNTDFLVYYPKKEPAMGTLQREFSIKKLVDFLLSLGLFLYFLFLNENYLQKLLRSLLKKDQYQEKSISL